MLLSLLAIMLTNIRAYDSILSDQETRLEVFYVLYLLKNFRPHMAEIERTLEWIESHQTVGMITTHVNVMVNHESDGVLPIVIKILNLKQCQQRKC